MSRRRPSFPNAARLGLLATAAASIVTLAGGVRSLPAQDASYPATLRSAAEHDYPPYSIVDAQGRADGFSVELLRAAAQAMGRHITFRTGTWHEIKGWLERGELDVLPLVGRTPERESVFDFTVPYMTLHGAIVVREGPSNIRGFADLAGRDVVVMRSDNAEEFLRRVPLDMGIHTTPTFTDALRELSEGRHDAVVIQRLVALRLLRETGFGNLRVLPDPLEDFRQDFCFAVREGDRDTLAVLNEGLALVIGDGTHRRLHSKWFASLDLPSDRRVIVGGDHAYPPFEFLDANGLPTGYNVDLTRAIGRAVGLQIEIRLGPWPATVRDLHDGEIDAVQGMYYSPARDAAFDFSSPHVVNHYVAVVRAGEGPAPDSLAALEGRRVVVQDGDIAHEAVLEAGLGQNVTAVATQEQALQELALGRHEVAVVSRFTAYHVVTTQGLAGLEVGQVPLRSFDYCYAVRDGHRAVLAAFAEGLKTLEQTGEFHRIQKRWLGVETHRAVTLRAVLRYVIMAAAPLVLLLIAFLVWSRSLQHQVARRTADLERSQARARALFEASPDAVFVIGPDGRYIDANPVAVERYGYALHEVLAMSPADLAAASARASITERLEQARQGPLRFDWRHRTRDGREFPVEVTSRPLILDGLSCVVASVRDISDRVDAEDRAARALEETQHLLREGESSRRILLSIMEDRERAEHQRSQLEEQLRQAQKMEAIGTLAGGVAHDFNNLLQAMLSQLHRAQLRPDDLETLGEVLPELEEHVRRGAALTRQLLLFSRRETATFAAVDLGAVVRGSAQFLRRLIRENVQFNVSCVRDSLPVEADRGQLDQVLVNLVVNASQAMPAGGVLTIGTERPDVETAALFVSDTGSGIPPHTLERIFEPFFTTKAAEHGTGLGLAVVHGIASRHGGRVEVESAVGKGSTFRLLLPLQQSPHGLPPETQHEQPAAEYPQGRGERILVVEDEQGAREGLEDILRLLGYEVVAVGSGAEASRQPLHPRFNLLLTDLMLPDVQGADLARSLSERWPGLKVILMSGYTADEVVRRGAAAGKLRFLQKPFDMSALAREIREATAGE